jgi:hypothetical protein
VKDYIEVNGCTIKVGQDADGMYTVYSPSGMRKAKWSDLTKEAQQALHEASTNAPKAD